MRFVQDLVVATLFFAAVLLILFWEIIFAPGPVWQRLLLLTIVCLAMGFVTALLQPKST